jgi:hypothetical protein
MQYRNEFGDHLDRQPHPQDLCLSAEPGADLVLVDVRQLKILEEVVVHCGAVLAGPREPGGDRGLAMPEHPYGSGDIESFRQGRQHLRNPLGRGFKSIQRRIAASTKGGATGLAAQGLSALRFPFGSITREAHGSGRR